MTARSVLRFYPRTWRARYEDEVLALCGDGELTFRQLMDLFAGAVDARLSAPVPRGGAAVATSDSTVGFLRRSCASRAPNYTTRDGLVSAAAIVGGSFLFMALGILANRNGWHETGEFLKGVGFPVSLLFSSNFTFMKGLPRRVRVVIIGGTVLFICLMGLVAAQL